MKAKIGYIDDSLLNLECIQSMLEQDFDVLTFNEPEAFLRDFSSAKYDCILLDIHMPIMDGFALYEKTIAHPDYNGCPILFISSDDTEASRIKSLSLGAVDFISRLISPNEMIARVKSKIQFFQSHRSIVEFDSLKVNLTLLKTYLNQQEIPLTFIELKILCLVLRNYPDPVPKDALIENIWKAAHVQDATIHTHLFNLNSKLDKWNYEIQSVKSKGVQLVRRDS